MNELDELARDLADEQGALDKLVAGLDESDWLRDTPARGWCVRDQIAHLAYFDAAAAQAITDSAAFLVVRDELVRAAFAEGVDEFTLRPFREMTPALVLAAWRENRATLKAAARRLTRESRVPWYGPDMSGRSFLTARLMETWAHGVDVADALGVAPSDSARLAHIVRLGVITRDWSYRVRAESTPEVSIAVRLDGADGTYEHGPSDAEEVLTGPALDFCLVVTQRRHVDDTALVTGAWGRHWMLRAQAFAGGPTTGPAPRST
ncbi:MAG TPA: TIGR03084 family metal-binding protein [Acidimicrobiales bacterium]|nr:TIGR03084 family metal-binding protein [Acidimicrobiales bacterium]